MCRDSTTPATAAAEDETFCKLNARVAHKSKQLLAEAKASGTSPSPEVEPSTRARTALWCGTPIYQPRSVWMVYVFAALSVGLIAHGFNETGMACSLVSFLATYLCYDCYSGVLHVFFDETRNLCLPVLGQPCLEFQWHHHLPDDIVRKGFVQACGDLNLVVGLSMCLHVGLTGNRGRDPLVLGLTGWKILAAYFGQFSHRSAHMGLSQRGPFLTKLQKTGLLTSPAQHHVHHTPPHSSNFCLLGPCNDFVQVLTRAIPDYRLWRVLFVVWSLFDIPLLAAALTRLGLN